jgi:hypothetical protein
MISLVQSRFRNGRGSVLPASGPEDALVSRPPSEGFDGQSATFHVRWSEQAEAGVNAGLTAGSTAGGQAPAPRPPA